MDDTPTVIQENLSSNTDADELVMEKPVRKKTSMSVKEMRELLGLKKVESYWLVQKGFFETRTVAGVMRVMINSFEDWYAHQFHYKKVNGSSPGAAFGETYSAEDLSRILGLARNTAQALLISTKELKPIQIGRDTRVRKEDFERWYSKQFRYHKVTGEEPGTEIENTMSMHEMCDLLGIKLRNTGYYLIKCNRFKSFMVAGQIRVDVKSFYEWLSNQNHYKIKNTKKEEQ